MTVFRPRRVDPDDSTDRGKVWRVATSGTGDSNEFDELVPVAVLYALPDTGLDDGKTIVFNAALGVFEVVDSLTVPVPVADGGTGATTATAARAALGAAKVSYGTSAPGSPATGDYWLDTN